MTKHFKREEKLKFMERFKAGESIQSLCEEAGCEYRCLANFFKVELKDDYRKYVVDNNFKRRAKFGMMNEFYLQIAEMIAKGTTFQALSETFGKSEPYIRWWCKKNLSNARYKQLRINRLKEKEKCLKN